MTIQRLHTEVELSPEVEQRIIKHHPGIIISEIKALDLPWDGWFAMYKEGYYIMRNRFYYYKNNRKHGYSCDIDGDNFWNYYKGTAHGGAHTYNRTHAGLGNDHKVYGLFWYHRLYGQLVDRKSIN